jgi:hypothetical protein
LQTVFIVISSRFASARISLSNFLISSSEGAPSSLDDPFGGFLSGSSSSSSSDSAASSSSSSLEASFFFFFEGGADLFGLPLEFF